jgi:hypothetical protein
VQIEETVEESGNVIVDRLELARSAEDLLLELKKRSQKESKALESYCEALRDYYDQLVEPRQDTDRARVEPWSLLTLETSLHATKNKLENKMHDADDARAGFRRLSLTDDAGEPDVDMAISYPTLCFHLQAISSCRLPMSKADLLPLPTPLRVRLSRRCRAELAEGRPGILLKPKLGPLEGDSSQRSGLGQWMKKVRLEDFYDVCPPFCYHLGSIADGYSSLA